MAKSDESITTDESKETRISPNYTKDFTSRVKSLQSFFAGKKRRALYDTLLAKGVITQHYSVTKWNNDFKAWKNNPNNGIFRYLEMVSAILDEANIPAFEIFGGPHARDTDEIIKSISSRIENYLDNSLEGFKDYKTKSNRTPQKSERIINGNAFKNMIKVHDEIAKHWGVNVAQYCPDNHINPALFFLYAWPDPRINYEETKMEDLHNCIDMLVKKMINSKFARYYFGYFFEPYDGKRFDPLSDYLRGHADHVFDLILNQALTLTYQLNYIFHIYGFYYTGKMISITNKSERKPIIMEAENSSTSEEEPMDIAQFYNISDIDVKSVYSLKVNKLCQGSKKDEPKEILNQRLQEFKKIYVGFVDSLCNDSTTHKNLYYNELYSNKRYLLLDYFEKNIVFFQTVMEYLNPNHVSHSKYLFSEYIYIGKRNNKKIPMKYHKERIILNIPQEMLDNLGQIIEQLNAISSAITRCDESTDTPIDPLDTPINSNPTSPKE